MLALFCGTPQVSFQRSPFSLDWEVLKNKVSTLEKYQNLTCNAIATQLVIVELINNETIK